MVLGEGTKVNLKGTKFINNAAGIGGAMLAFRTKVNMYSTVFSNNKDLENINDIAILDDLNPKQNGTFVQCDSRAPVRFCDGLLGILELSGKSFQNTNCNRTGLVATNTNNSPCSK